MLVVAIVRKNGRALGSSRHPGCAGHQECDYVPTVVVSISGLPLVEFLDECVVVGWPLGEAMVPSSPSRPLDVGGYIAPEQTGFGV